MIKVKVIKNKEHILEVKVTGHANSAEYGKDLVCAGVSTICIGIANTLVKHKFLENNEIEIKEGYVHIKVNQSSHDIQVVLGTFEVMLDTIEESYSQYIKITKMEV